MTMKRTLIQEFNERADYKRRQITLGRKWLNSVEMREIMSSFDYLAERAGTSCDPYFDGGYNAVYITLRNLDGLKDPKLEQILNSVIHLEPDATETNDTPASLTRSYVFRWNSKDSEFYGSLNLTVTASFKEESETCRKVIVGYKEPSKEATPIYELRCADALSTEAPIAE